MMKPTPSLRRGGAILACITLCLHCRAKGADDFSSLETALLHDYPARREAVLFETPPEAEAERAAWLAEITAVAGNNFRETGNMYRHYPFELTSSACIYHGETCANLYLGHQASRARDDAQVIAGTPANMPASKTSTTEMENLTRKIKKTAGGDSKTSQHVWLLDNEPHADALRDAAWDRFKELSRIDIAFTRINLRDRKNFPPTYFTAAILYDDRIYKDVISAMQMGEIFSGQNTALNWQADAKLKKIKIFDAHIHLLRGGALKLEKIRQMLGIENAVLMALPKDTRYAGLAAANAYVKKNTGVRDRFLALINPGSDKPLAQLHALGDKKSAGIKLLSGHGTYFENSGRKPLQHAALDELLAHCMREKQVVLWHVNDHLYREGFTRALAKFPELKFINPHFGGYLTYAPDVVRELLERYPNLYFDISLGGDPSYIRRGIEDLSYLRHKWRKIFIDYADRFLFATDLVVTENIALSHVTMLHALYRNLLEKDEYDFDFFYSYGYTKTEDASHHRAGLRGLGLPEPVLVKIYAENARRLFGFE